MSLQYLLCATGYGEIRSWAIAGNDGPLSSMATSSGGGGFALAAAIFASCSMLTIGSSATSALLLSRRKAGTALSRNATSQLPVKQLTTKRRACPRLICGNACVAPIASADTTKFLRVIDMVLSVWFEGVSTI